MTPPSPLLTGATFPRLAQHFRQRAAGCEERADGLATPANQQRLRELARDLRRLADELDGRPAR